MLSGKFRCIADVGTGAGLAGYSAWRLWHLTVSMYVLVDSNSKKTRFLLGGEKVVGFI